jgi:hypothetical protein
MRIMPASEAPGLFDRMKAGIAAACADDPKAESLGLVFGCAALMQSRMLAGALRDVNDLAPAGATDAPTTRANLPARMLAVLLKCVNLRSYMAPLAWQLVNDLCVGVPVAALEKVLVPQLNAHIAEHGKVNLGTSDNLVVSPDAIALRLRVATVSAKAANTMLRDTFADGALLSRVNVTRMPDVCRAAVFASHPTLHPMFAALLAQTVPDTTAADWTLDGLVDLDAAYTETVQRVRELMTDAMQAEGYARQTKRKQVPDSRHKLPQQQKQQSFNNEQKEEQLRQLRIAASKEAHAAKDRLVKQVAGAVTRINEVVGQSTLPAPRTLDAATEAALADFWYAVVERGFVDVSQFNVTLRFAALSLMALLATRLATRHWHIFLTPQATRLLLTSLHARPFGALHAKAHHTFAMMLHAAEQSSGVAARVPVASVGVAHKF